jgi:hypothetical protein
MIVRCDNFSLFTFRYFRRGPGNRRTAGEARALDDANAARAAKRAREFGRTMSKTASS